MFLDNLFYKSLKELMELPNQELKQKKQYAHTLLLCLDSIMTLKSRLANSTRQPGDNA